MISVEEIVRAAGAINASDIHLIAGLPPKCRSDGKIQDLFPEPLTPTDCEHIARELAADDYDNIEQIGELDLGRTIAGRRCRINLFRQQGSVSTALRILREQIADMDDLGLPKSVYTFPSIQRGIILVTGETGSGKSTTLAAIINRINHTRQEHIITLEDPIEYIYTPDQCIINQREVGKDTKSFSDGLRAALREDPDVILVGEMRDPITIETALTAAETGHLVLATLHTNSAVESVDRIVGSFPAERQQQIRNELSITLQGVIAQQLLPAVGKGRVLACEVMIVTSAIRNLIREGKTAQMASSLLSSGNEGSITMDNCLLGLVNARKISRETAVEAAADRAYLKKRLMMT
jgi:twitching motility protein PilT